MRCPFRQTDEARAAAAALTTYQMKASSVGRYGRRRGPTRVRETQVAARSCECGVLGQVADQAGSLGGRQRGPGEGSEGTVGRLGLDAVAYPGRSVGAMGEGHVRIGGEAEHAERRTKHLPGRGTSGECQLLVPEVGGDPEHAAERLNIGAEGRQFRVVDIAALDAAHA